MSPPSGLVAPDAEHPAREDADGNQVIQTNKVTERGLAQIVQRHTWKALATATEAVEIADDSGDKLHV